MIMKQIFITLYCGHSVNFNKNIKQDNEKYLDLFRNNLNIGKYLQKNIDCFIDIRFTKQNKKFKKISISIAHSCTMQLS